MKRSILIITSLLFIVLVLSVVRTIVSNGMSTSGSQLSKLSEDLDYYKTENASLKEKVYTKSSLTSIASEAAKLGFVDQKSSFAVSNALPIAVKQ
jgi:cell division protein FtsL